MSLKRFSSTKIQYIAIVTIYLFGFLTIFGSASGPRHNLSPSEQKKNRPDVEHQYELTVVDVDGKPLKGVKVDYVLKNNERLEKKSSCITNSDGKVSVSLTATPDPEIEMYDSYKSIFKFELSKDDYYSKNDYLSIRETDNYFPQQEVKKITLIRPIDYFNKEFASKLSNEKLKTKILEFIDLVILEGLVNDTVLETRSINLETFKDNSYLQFKFTNTKVYNSLQLDKYDIGKRLFDDVVRNVLTPLNKHVGNSNLFYGYDLTIVGHTKNLAEEYSTAESIEYRYMIPEKVVRSYKNKNISGQQVLDASIILMDNERIELNLH